MKERKIETKNYIIMYDIIDILKIFAIIASIVILCYIATTIKETSDQVTEQQKQCTYQDTNYLSKAAQCDQIEPTRWLCGSDKKPSEYWLKPT